MKKNKSQYRQIDSLYQESLFILKKLVVLRGILGPSEQDLEDMAFLRLRFNELNPRYRFVWLDGKPVIDIWLELLKLEKECFYGKDT